MEKTQSGQTFGTIRDKYLTSNRPKFFFSCYALHFVTRLDVTTPLQRFSSPTALQLQCKAHVRSKPKLIAVIHRHLMTQLFNKSSDSNKGPVMQGGLFSYTSPMVTA